MIENFTPWSALVGGLLIGVGSLGVFLFFGRVAGISGILGQALKGNPVGMDWRIGFLIGLIGAPLVYQVFARLPDFDISNSTWLLIIAGVLVGFGTRLGNGCTSGHGISGMSRLSLRSIVAVMTFMVVAVGVNFIF